MIPKQKRNSGLRYFKILPPTHDCWLIERDNGVGASEAGGLLNCSKYTTPYRIWRKKLGMDKPVEENWAMKQGHLYEAYIAQLFEEEIGYKVIKASAGDWLAVDNEKSYLRVSPDWIYYKGKKSEKNKCVLECKTSRNRYTPECLADECLSWFIQVQYQMYVLGCEEAYLGFLCVETGEHWFEYIPYNAEFCNGTLIPAIDNFWNNHIIPAREHLAKNKGCSMEELEQFAPDNVDAEDVTTRFPKQEDGKTIESNADIIENLQIYCQLRSRKKCLEEDMKKIEDSFKLAMGDAESIVDANGKPYMTFKANKASMKFDEKKFAAECPDQYEQYLFEKAGARILRIK